MSTSKTTTGRYLVLLENGQNTASSIEQLESLCGVKAKSSTEFPDEIVTASDIDKNDAIVFDKIGVAVISKKAASKNTVSNLMGNSNYIVEPERIVQAIGMDAEEFRNYVEGYRDATNSMADKVLGEQATDLENYANYFEEEATVDTQAGVSTWGLRATRVIPPIFFSGYSGQGTKVAVLDTGFDPSHPDFSTRNIVSKSFVPDQAVQDAHGHGTHCTGTACGPASSSDTNIERYGIAYNSDVYIGKVLNNQGSGADGWILAGINWAISQNVDVINMSLGAATNSGGFSSVYESVAKNALASGTLIIAAAGNDSNRPGTIRAVSHPANCPSIMAVGAVDSNMGIARFSNGGLFPSHGAVDIVGPGVAVLSSVSKPHTGLPTIPVADRFGSINGTSMAAPHVAGIAALYVESHGVRGQALWDTLVNTARNLPLPARDDGAGLVQAPIKRRFAFPPDWWQVFPPIRPWPPIQWPPRNTRSNF